MSLNFSSLGVPQRLVAFLHEPGITEPYPIQSTTLPDALHGEDLFAQFPTGSEETLAIALPLVERVAATKCRAPRILVLAPTRELAAQISEMVHSLARSAHLSVSPFYGGTGYKIQLNALAQGRVA